MNKYPISFFGKSSITPGIDTNWNSSAGVHEQICAVPTEFDGPGNGMSPEDFYLLALQNCFLATFKVYSHYSKLQFDKVEVKSELIVDLNEMKKPCMKKIIMHIDIFNPSDVKKAQLLVNKTLDNGFILQSVQTEILPMIEFH